MFSCNQQISGRNILGDGILQDTDRITRVRIIQLRANDSVLETDPDDWTAALIGVDNNQFITD